MVISHQTTMADQLRLNIELKYNPPKINANIVT